METSLHVCVEKKVKNWTSMEKWRLKKDTKSYYKAYWDKDFFSTSHKSFVEFMSGKGKEGFTPITSHPGVPEDLSDKVRNYFESWGVDAHSPAWIMLSELQAFDWDAKAVRYGFLTGDDYKNRHEEACWPVDPNYFTEVSSDEMDRLIAVGEERLQDYCCKTTWLEPYRGMFPWLMRVLKELENETDPIRLFFWLDN